MARAFLALGLALVIGCSARQQSGEAVQPPNAVLADTTPGNQLFHGVGDCSDCHGDRGSAHRKGRRWWTAPGNAATAATSGCFA